MYQHSAGWGAPGEGRTSEEIDFARIGGGAAVLQASSIILLSSLLGWLRYQQAAAVCAKENVEEDRADECRSQGGKHGVQRYHSLGTRKLKLLLDLHFRGTEWQSSSGQHTGKLGKEPGSRI